MIDTAATSEPATSEPSAESEVASSQPARRTTKFMAELSRAMLGAAESSRSETMARFESDAKGVVEGIHARATNEAADIRRKADDDVAAIREWSKAEMARVREQTETRIAARKSGLDGEMEQHASTTESRAEQIAAVVAEFEARMTAFFERLNAEEDPTRIATMAETMPEPPSLADVVASMISASADAAAPLSGPPTDADFAAAEAEAATFSGDLDAEDDDLTAAEASVSEASAPGTASSGRTDKHGIADLTSTRVIVAGLVSVANIANFKRSLARTAGVSTIAVASGPDGEFVFTIGHSLGAALSASIAALPGFNIQLTGESDDAIQVAAQDRDATD
jgi:uncharacterized protein YukE